MSVTNRKMFRRDARNKLRNMGGIMASSEPLIQEVARFNQGMTVRANQAPLVGPVNPPYRPTSIFEKGYSGPMFLEDLRAGKFGNFKFPSIINPETGGVKAIEYVRDKTLEDLDIGPMEDAESGVFTRSGKILDNNPALKTFLTTGSTSGYDRFGDVFDDILTDGVQVLGAGVIDVLFDKNLQFIPDRNQPTDKALVEFMSGDRDKIPTDMRNPKKMLQFIASSGLPKETKKKLAKELPITDASVFRKKEAKTAIAGGAPDPAQTGTTDADEIQKALDAAELKAERGPGGAEARLADMTGGRRGTLETDELFKKDLQDEISGGRISSGAEQTLGVTADQGEEAKGDKATKDYVEGEGSKADIKAGVTRVVSSGVGTGGALKQLVKEFTDNAPEYKGMDKGLAIAKIGFAMAAGQSPNAITNIAKALEQGADMFIEDNAKRDAFNRQVQLSALQYGLGEVSKQRAQGRADARNFDTYVVGKGGYTAPDGTKFKEGQMVELSMAERLKNGDKMNNLASLTALKERKEFQLKEMEIKTAQLELLKAASGNKIFEEGVSPENFQKMKNDYVDLIGKAEDATRAKAVFQQLYDIVDNPETSPFRSGFLGFVGEKGGEIATFFNIEVDKKYTTRREIEELALSAMGDITSVVLGKTQSANSISDRDVLFNILRPFFGNLIKQDTDGTFSINLTQKSLVLGQIDRAVARLDDAQVQSLRTADGIYESFDYIPKVKGTTGSALDLLGDVAKERRQAFGKLGSELEFDVTYDGDVATGLSLRETS